MVEIRIVENLTHKVIKPEPWRQVPLKMALAYPTNPNEVKQLGEIQVNKFYNRHYAAMISEMNKEAKIIRSEEEDLRKDATAAAEIYHANATKREFVIPQDGGLWKGVRPSSRIRQ